MKGVLISSFFLLLFGRAYASYNELDTLPLRAGGLLSTNWLALVKEAIPTARVTSEASFQSITNTLCRESRRGNTAAQGLWGFLLLVQSQSPDDAATGLDLLRNSATNGFVPAMINLGLLSEGGVYLPLNYPEAFHWFNEAAKRENSEALLQLGGCYHYGLGTERNFVKAAECYRRAAEHTNYVAMKSLGHLLMNGLGVAKDTDAAQQLFLRAANEGNNRRAMLNLGSLCYSRSSSDTNAMRDAFQWFRRSAELGDGMACYHLANFYGQGWGGVKTNLEAFYFWRNKAAVAGVTAAQYAMSVAYRIGDGVPKNSETSVAWCRKAAMKNHPSALYDLAVHNLLENSNRVSRLLAQNYMLQAAQAGHRGAQFQCAIIYFRGDAGPPDCDAGNQWLLKAAENGWAAAEYLLFQLYFNGVAPGPSCPAYPKDVPCAVKWLCLAAEHEHLPAQSVLAVMLIKGRDLPVNKPEAERLLRYAAEHGYPQAQNDLGFAILNGDTAKADLIEAATWCRLAQSRLASTNVLHRAEVNLSNILSKLNPNQRLEVETRASGFRPVAVAEVEPVMKGWETNSAFQEDDGRFGH